MPLPAGMAYFDDTAVDAAGIPEWERVGGKTHGRFTSHDGAHGGAGDGRTQYQADHDERLLTKAARRAAHPERQQFARRLGRPEDEDAVVERRRQAQEDEWRGLLKRGKRSVRSGARTARSSCSGATATTATTAMTTMTAGLRTDDAKWRTDDNRRAAFGRMVLPLCEGDLMPAQPPLPLRPPRRAPESESGTSALEGPAEEDGLDRLSRLLQLGTRPWG